MKLEEILFPVRSVETKTLLGGGYDISFPRQQSILVDTKDGTQLVNVASPGYKLIPNQELYPQVEASLQEAGIKYSVDYKNRNNSVFYGDYILQGAEFKVAKARGRDDIKPLIRIGNSYDSSTKLGVSFAFYRMICTNGLHGIKYEQKRFRHSGTVKLFVEQIPMMVNQYLDDAELLVTKYFEVLSDKVVPDYADRVIEVITSLNLFKVTKSDKNPANSIATQYVLDTVASEADTLEILPNDWIIYNAVNSYLFNNQLNKKSEEDRMKLDERVMSYLMEN